MAFVAMLGPFRSAARLSHFVVLLLAGTLQNAVADDLRHINEGMNGVVLTKEPCFSESTGPSSYWDAVAKHDQETIKSFADNNAVNLEYHLAPELQWLQKGTRLRVLDADFDSARISIETGPAKGQDCYVRNPLPPAVSRF